jgi:hypothetical protein
MSAGAEDRTLRYATGEIVRLGDRVRLGLKEEGAVVAVIGDDAFSEAYPKRDWDYLGQGALVHFPAYGLLYYEDWIEPDLALIARGEDLA